ncbi:S1C family serine protease [Terrabacter ginsenosidimutans]|uniref:S1C family serine protease n=1 Tax=Terrabacter ginsenosidimutans TaxID=490575 RepID=UPI0031E659DA
MTTSPYQPVREPETLNGSPLPATLSPVPSGGRGRVASWVVAALLLANLGVLGYGVVQQRQGDAKVTELTAALGKQASLIKDLRTDLGTVSKRAAGAEAAAKSASNDAARASDAASKAGTEASKANTEASKATKAQQEAKAATLDTKSVADKATPSIVTVHCGSALGSGFAIKAASPSGYQTAILTNEHVVDECTLVGGPDPYASHGTTKFAATLGEFDTYNDLAIIYIKPKLSPLEVAATATVGDPVVAIGSPYGLEGTVTTGIISRMNQDWYQTSALINHGNSGGPLLDRRGDVLGVNTIDVGGGGTGLGGSIRFRLVCQVIAKSACS